MNTRRGFMLVEALVGSALVGVAVTVVLHQLALGDQFQSLSARRGVAHAAVWDQVNRYRATAYDSFPADGTAADQPVPGVSPHLMRSTVTVTTLGAAAACRLCKQVDVRVEYKDAHRLWRALAVTTYVAQP